MSAESRTNSSAPVLITVGSEIPQDAAVFILSGDALGWLLYDYCRDQGIRVAGIIAWDGDTAERNVPTIPPSKLSDLGTHEANLLISRRDYHPFLTNFGSVAFKGVYVAHPFAQALLAQRVTPYELSRGQIFDAAATEAPSPQRDLDIFAGEWMAEVPIPGTKSGWNKLFVGDGRLAFASGALRGLQGLNILELGPYEGAHTYALEKTYGASSVTAIEANTRAFLRCLIIKNLFGLRNSRFLLGNFLKFLKQTNERYDLIFASGVLYHMTNPAELLEFISRRTHRVFLWTHYYDENAIKKNSVLNSRFDYTKTRQSRLGRYSYTEYCFVYADRMKKMNHFGGVEEYVYWLSADDIVGLLRELGFKRIQRGLVDHEHVSGPNLCIVAERFVWYDPDSWPRRRLARAAKVLRSLVRSLRHLTSAADRSSAV